ncbi:MAG TPA: NifB/NifX family molybdenum-iron cluster-binding protein [Anaerolineae bacterium]|nr:NifB/NifX family molybdenum-iron cluster-binding protein [Anaerolineae bacterium]HPL28261.1 NifB/NifX family molybdenum-iron cluster-binding protein [Anaerolineae bacterium]
MKVVVTAQGVDPDAVSSPIFGRCPAFVFVDTETMQFEGIENPCAAAGGGAGIQAAQLVVERGATVLLSHNVGPNAFAVLQAAEVATYRIGGGTVREAVAALLAGTLPRLDGPSTDGHRRRGRSI